MYIIVRNDQVFRNRRLTITFSHRFYLYDHDSCYFYRDINRGIKRSSYSIYKHFSEVYNLPENIYSLTYIQSMVSYMACLFYHLSVIFLSLVPRKGCALCLWHFLRTHTHTHTHTRARIYKNAAEYDGKHNAYSLVSCKIVIIYNVHEWAKIFNNTVCKRALNIWLTIFEFNWTPLQNDLIAFMIPTALS